MPLAKILLATDGSPEAASAARMAITLSRSLGGELHVVYVGVAPSAYAAAESEILDYEFWKELREIAQNEASQSVEEEVRKIEGTGGKVEMVHVAMGHPNSEILRIAEEIGADLVVVGSRGLGPLRRALMGSVSETVVGHAHCSVLVVRGEDHDEGYLPGRVLLALDGSKGRTEPSGWRPKSRPPRVLYSASCAYSRPNSTGPTRGPSTGRVGRPTSSTPSVKSRPFWTDVRGAYGPKGPSPGRLASVGVQGLEEGVGPGRPAS